MGVKNNRGDHGRTKRRIRRRGSRESRGVSGRRRSRREGENKLVRCGSEGGRLCRGGMGVRIGK